MDRAEIPQEVLRFIERRMDSVPHLETLLLLWENPSKPWKPADIASRVYIDAARARHVLEDLARHGLLAPATPEGYVFNAGWDESRLMEKVAAAYRRHLVPIAGLIHAKGASQAVQDFARAFQFKPEE